MDEARISNVRASPSLIEYRTPVSSVGTPV